MNDEIRKWIYDEVDRRMAPIAADIAVALQLAPKVASIELSLRGLYRNGGSGPPGFIEMAHAENSGKMERIWEKLDAVCEQIAEDRGKDELLLQQKKEIQEELESADKRKTSRAERIKHYAQIASVFGGAWLLTLVRPILHALMEVAAKAIH